MSMTESESQETVRTTGELGTLASGGITQVPSGVNLTVVEPKAAGGYVEYVKYQLHLIASGMGVTYEMMTGDVREVNFSSARVSMLEFRRNAEQMQWLTLIPRLCEPIWIAFVEAAAMAGKMKATDRAVDWATPKWDYVNPEQDVKADLAEISGGLTTISEKLRKRGYKPDLVFAEMKSDFDRLRSDGTLDIMLQIQTGQAPQAPAAASTAARAIEQAQISTADALHRIREDAARQHNLLTGLVSATERAAGAASVQRDASPPVVHVHQAPVTVHPAGVTVNVPETTVNVEATMPTPNVEVRNEITNAAPAVHVTNQVQPATVALTATLPARTTETVIERDARGNISRSTSTERDA